MMRAQLRGVVLQILGLTMGVAGVAMQAFSFLSRSHRQEPARGKFWAPKSSFTASEYAANRVGFVLAIAGLAFVTVALLP